MYSFFPLFWPPFISLGLILFFPNSVMGITIISCFLLYCYFFIFFLLCYKSNKILILQLLGKEVTDMFCYLGIYGLTFITPSCILCYLILELW